MANKTERLCMIKKNLSTNMSTNMSHSSPPLFTTIFFSNVASTNLRSPFSFPSIHTKFFTRITNFLMIYRIGRTPYYALFNLFNFLMVPFSTTWMLLLKLIWVGMKIGVRNSYDDADALCFLIFVTECRSLSNHEKGFLYLSLYL